MKLKRFIFLSIFILIISISSNAQRIKLLSGNLTELKAQKSFYLKFAYDSMLVGKDLPEKQYLERKKNEWDLKDSKSGAAFISKWYVDREKLYEPTFTNYFINSLKRVTNDKNSKHTLILKTKRTEGGWYGGVISHSGEIDGELWIVESENEANIIAKIGFYNIAGKVSDGGDFEMTKRIQSSYENAGKLIGSYLFRKLK